MIGETVSHYKILEKLGEGGMGVVFKATDTKLDREVALKFLPQSALESTEDKARFEQEAKASAKINHNNIAHVYEIDHHGDEAFIAMELIGGGTLFEKIEQGPLKLEETLEIASQIAAGLQAAHEKKIVHRDIKSQNVMLTEKGVVKITDFGLAKLGSRSKKLTQEGTTLGTIAYMSPEQARGDEVDHRSDIFSMGALIYEMLTGQLPFKGEYDQAVTYSILNEDPEPVTAVRTGIPLALERIVQKCMEKDVSVRYQHADEIIADLKGLATSGSTSEAKHAAETRPESRPVTLVSRRTLIPLGILLVVLIGVALIRFWPSGEKAALESVAILPLANLSGDSGQDYFVDGLSEALITELGKIRALRVISRQSVMRYKNTDKSLPSIAEELNVDAIVEGSAMQVGGDVRITVKLVDAQKDEQLWGQSYDREMSDILAVYSEVASAIVQEIQIKLTPEEKQNLLTVRQVLPAAHEAYLKGRYHWNKFNISEFDEAFGYFQQAVNLDPNYALAWVGLADVYKSMGFNNIVSPEEARAKAKSAVQRALELDPNLGEAHATLGSLYLYFDWDWSAAETAFRRAIELNPGYVDLLQWYGDYFEVIGQYDEAIRMQKMAKALNPVLPAMRENLVYCYLFDKQYDLAIAEGEQTIQLDAGYADGHLALGLAYEYKNRIEEALAALHESIRLSKTDIKVAVLAGLYVKAGEGENARTLLDELLQKRSRSVSSPYSIAYIQHRLGDVEQTFNWLDIAYEERDPYLLWAKAFGFFESLNEDPRYGQLLRKLNLAD